MNKHTKLVLLRHGESQWNKKNKFTGWKDIDLSNQGLKEAKSAGTMLKKHGFIFDYAFSSLLKRSIHTLWHILDKLDLAWIPVKKSWRLNERHYGALQGLNKLETAKKYGDHQVKEWRRSFSVCPPKIKLNDINYPGNDIKYAKLNKNQIPLSESLEDTMNRVITYWIKQILPKIKKNKKIIIVAHGNSLRGLIKYLEDLNEKEIFELNIPTGIPMIYKLNKNFKIMNKYYL